MSHFDERSGVVYCSTEWGQWAQTIEEVFIEVDVPDGTKSKDIRCDMTSTSISVTVNHQQIFKVSPPRTHDIMVYKCNLHENCNFYILL